MIARLDRVLDHVALALDALGDRTDSRAVTARTALRLVRLEIAHVRAELEAKGS